MELSIPPRKRHQEYIRRLEVHDTIQGEAPDLVVIEAPE
jgi:hypothetical protein